MDASRLYRAQARSYERQATEARRVDARKELLELAKLWDRVADEAQRSERVDAAAPGTRA